MMDKNQGESGNERDAYREGGGGGGRGEGRMGRGTCLWPDTKDSRRRGRAGMTKWV